MILRATYLLNQYIPNMRVSKIAQICHQIRYQQQKHSLSFFAPSLQNWYQQHPPNSAIIPNTPQNIIPIEKKVFATSPISACMTSGANCKSRFLASPIIGPNVMTRAINPPGRTTINRTGMQGKQNGLPIQRNNGIIPKDTK